AAAASCKKVRRFIQSIDGLSGKRFPGVGAGAAGEWGGGAVRRDGRGGGGGKGAGRGGGGGGCWGSAGGGGRGRRATPGGGGGPGEERSRRTTPRAGRRPSRSVADLQPRRLWRYPFLMVGRSIALLTLVAAAACAADWPQWRGVNRDGISVETGLLESWPAGG